MRLHAVGFCYDLTLVEPCVLRMKGLLQQCLAAAALQSVTTALLRYQQPGLQIWPPGM